MPFPYRSVFDEPVIRRVRVTPDKPDEFPQRAPRTRRPHGEAQVAAVRHLIEQTELTYSEIAKKTGVGRASICRWTRDQKWVRPVFAPRATDTIPRARASAKLKRRTLAARLDALAERYVRELEADAGVDLDKLAAALELAKMAKLAAKPKKRRRTLARERRDALIREQREAVARMEREAVARMQRSEIRDHPFPQTPDCAALHPGYERLPGPVQQREAANIALSPLVPAQKREARLMQKAGTQTYEKHESPAEVLARLRAEGVRLDRAPEAAVKDFIDSHRPPEDDRHFRARGGKSRRKRAHRQMLDWGRD
jgi:hypothetical protein